MKPTYKVIKSTAREIEFKLTTQAQFIGSDGVVLSSPLKAEDVTVRMAEQGVTGTKNVPCTVSKVESNYLVSFGYVGLQANRAYEFDVLVTFGTNTQVVYIAKVTTGAISTAKDTVTDTVTIVRTAGDGQGVTPSQLQEALATKANVSDVSELELAVAGKADGSIYAVGESGDPAQRDVAKIHGSAVEMSNTARATAVNAAAQGTGTIARTTAQMVVGKYNVEDTNGDYALIVGNGTDDNARSNAFAIDWSGNLVLFDNGTPVVLTPSKLATLIA